MKEVTIMKMTAILVTALIVMTSAWACGPPAHADEVEATQPPSSKITRLTFLPPEVSRSLKIAQVPTDRPVPLIFGSYWNCIIDEDTGFENCDLELVVCDNQQTQCVQIP